MKLTGAELTNTLGNFVRLECADLNTGFNPAQEAVLKPTAKPTLGLGLN